MNKKQIIKILAWITLIAFLVYILFFYALHDINKQKRFLRSQIASLNKEMLDLKKENEELEQGILQVDEEEFLEKEARVNMGYKKDGEKTVILKINTTTTKSDQQLKMEASVWYKIKQWFGDLSATD